MKLNEENRKAILTEFEKDLSAVDGLLVELSAAIDSDDQLADELSAKLKENFSRLFTKVYALCDSNFSGGPSTKARHWEEMTALLNQVFLRTARLLGLTIQGGKKPKGGGKNGGKETKAS